MTQHQPPDLEELAKQLAVVEARIRRLQIALWIVGTLCVIGLLRDPLWLAAVILVVSVAVLVPAGWLVLRYAHRRDERWRRENEE